MREENRDPDIMESSNLTDAEFKTLVIKMLNELHKFSKIFDKEIKKHKNGNGNYKRNQSEMKNTLSEMRSILNGINKGINKVNKKRIK